MNKLILFSIILTFTILLSFPMASVYAHPHPGQLMINNHTHKPQTEILPLNSMVVLEKSTVFFHASESNTLPWAFVEGNITNHVEGYPVIIQIFRNNEVVHFAQTNVEVDGDYEYKFRVLNIYNGVTTQIFDGDYTVKIFKVVYLNQNSVI